LSPLLEIIADEIDSDGSFLTGSTINVISAHVHKRNRQNIAKIYSDTHAIPLLVADKGDHGRSLHPMTPI